MLHYSEQADNQLMQAIAGQDAEAFNELYKRYSTRLLHFFYTMLHKDREKSQDFLQDLFTKIIEKPHLYDPSRSFTTWIYTLARNMCKNEYRSMAVRSDPEVAVNYQVLLHSETTPNMDKLLDASAFREQLWLQLDQLGPEKKETFILRYQQNKSLKEISEIMDCAEGTIKSRLFYTLKWLADKLEVFDPKI